MPGHFGTLETEDGAYSESQSSAHVGFFGNNTSTDVTAGGGAGGSGVFGLTVTQNAPGVFGANNGVTGVGVQGNGPDAGVSGFSENGNGLRAFSNGGDALYAATGSSGHVGVFGNNTSTAEVTGGGAGGAGVFGLTVSQDGAGVFGSNNGPKGVGVQGNGPDAGVSGFSENGVAVRGHSNHNDGGQLFAHDVGHNGVLGLNDASGSAPAGSSPVGNGVYGYTAVTAGSGVVGAVASTNPTGAGVTGIGPVAGRFFGDVVVTGDVQLTGGDLAEEFHLVGDLLAGPGSVVVLAGLDHVRVSDRPYDRRVAGVVSGAGNYRPALVLDRRPDQPDRFPLALNGKVWCNVDADSGSIEVGDLLTTSSRPGHAMRATDPQQSFGAVIGKSLGALAKGQGLLPILVALQ
ncbi:hypothetical protein [Nakamurella sp. PAMC28650]|uniref:hypothetical protein n=1 Tax=Nakamurella sp. PAMC28650 TaxID=2762325 RepID=UPI00164E5B70|nr:hypothetical protein [Nakamurella sp. PAMC28650]QNK82892.1 hypothetical protein H7F38_09595 [Nakamurella sp. PAMC28650]